MKICKHTGNANKVDSKGRKNFTFNAYKSGVFRINIEYSLGCQLDRPISEARCRTKNIVYSNEFTINKEKSDKEIYWILDR